MRLMRPGSCVGPQQHFLYENQLEWVRWSAQDALRAELAAQHGLAGTTFGAAKASSSAQERRPTTPLADELSAGAAALAASTTPGPGAVPPVTPRRTGANVPGQPRKTPGRSRHAVAQPEEVSPQEKERLEAEMEEERMEGVVLSSPRKRTSDVGGAAGAGMGKGKAPIRMADAVGAGAADDDEDPLALVSPKKLHLAPAASIAASASARASTSTAAPPASRPKTPSAATSTRPTRVPRPARPLSALADNRIVDRLASTSQGTRMSTRTGQAPPSPSGAGAGAGLARSKAAKNLNTVFEADSSAAGQSRYPLRNTRSSGGTAAATAGAHQPQPPNSPTKLPQRVLGKRDAAPARESSQGSSSTSSSVSSAAPGSRAGSVASSAGGFDPASAVPLAGKIGGRNVRRRRSSMGSQETVNAG